MIMRFLLDLICTKNVRKVSFAPFVPCSKIIF